MDEAAALGLSGACKLPKVKGVLQKRGGTVCSMGNTLCVAKGRVSDGIKSQHVGWSRCKHLAKSRFASQQ